MQEHLFVLLVFSLKSIKWERGRQLPYVSQKEGRVLACSAPERCLWVSWLSFLQGKGMHQALIVQLVVEMLVFLTSAPHCVRRAVG